MFKWLFHAWNSCKIIQINLLKALIIKVLVVVIGRPQEGSRGEAKKGRVQHPAKTH